MLPLRDTSSKDFKTSNFYILRPSITLKMGKAEAALLEKTAVFCRGKAHTLKGGDQATQSKQIRSKE